MADIKIPAARSRIRQRLRGMLLGARKEFSPDERHHESNLAWGPIAIGCSIVLTVVAAMKHDLRFLFFVAWPCFAFGAWHLCKRIPYRALSYWIAGIFCVLVAGILWGLNLWLSPPRGDTKMHPPHSLDTRTSGSATVTAPEGGWMESWESIGTNLRVVARTSTLLPYRLHLHLILVIRVEDDLVDEMGDMKIEKSAPYSISEDRLAMEMPMSQAFMARAYPGKTGRISLVLLPNPVVPDQINSLGDVERLGGKILVTNGIALHVSKVISPAARSSSHAPPESAPAPNSDDCKQWIDRCSNSQLYERIVVLLGNVRNLSNECTARDKRIFGDEQELIKINPNPGPEVIQSRHNHFHWEHMQLYAEFEKRYVQDYRTEAISLRAETIRRVRS